jgi:polyhydroxyalkanoate synthase
MEVGGIKLNLKKIDLPIFSVATREDHIAPAESVFRGMQMLSGPVEFVLAGSGHIAGVINPPAKAKYQYWTKGTKMTNLADWQASATVFPGSWWPYWIEWLSQQSGGWIPSRTPGAKLGVIEDAPGSYVKAR